jgi:hypothetical protein
MKLVFNKDVPAAFLASTIVKELYREFPKSLRSWDCLEDVVSPLVNVGRVCWGREVYCV